MSLEENRTRRNYKRFRPSRAFLYKEKHLIAPTVPEKPSRLVTYYIMKFNDNIQRNGCYKIQTTDEEIILREIIREKSNGVKFVHKLPPNINSLENMIQTFPESLNVTITREPYTPVFSSKASARYQGDK